MRNWKKLSIKLNKKYNLFIDKDDTLSNQHKLLCSVDGIGDRTAIKMIVKTNAFQDFKDPRKFAVTQVLLHLNILLAVVYIQEKRCQTERIKALKPFYIWQHSQ